MRDLFGKWVAQKVAVSGMYLIGVQNFNFGNKIETVKYII